MCIPCTLFAALSVSIVFRICYFDFVLYWITVLVTSRDSKTERKRERERETEQQKKLTVANENLLYGIAICKRFRFVLLLLVAKWANTWLKESQVECDYIGCCALCVVLVSQYFWAVEFTYENSFSYIESWMNSTHSVHIINSRKKKHRIFFYIFASLIRSLVSKQKRIGLQSPIGYLPSSFFFRLLLLHFDVFVFALNCFGLNADIFGVHK